MSVSRPVRHERRPEERPREILDAALTVFAERGYRNARIDDVAEAAGVTKGAVYHHFDTKEELLRRAIADHLEAAHLDMEEHLRMPGTPASVRIRALLRRAFGRVSPNGRKVMAVLFQGLRQEVPDVYREWMRDGPVKAWQRLAGLIVEGSKRGEFRTDIDAEAAARLVVSGLLTQLLWQPLGEDLPELAIDTDRLIDTAVDLLLQGLRPIAVLR